jgi:hypothetical protein
MGNTANNNWPYPESTDLVKDGATAIENLADAIDTTLGVYAPSTSGLELINTTAFSAVASQSINDVFSTTYDHYKILMTVVSSAAESNLNLRFRVSGTDNSSSVYSTQRLVALSTTLTGFSQDNQTSAIFQIHNLNENVIEATIFNPFLTARTYYNTTGRYATGSDAPSKVDFAGVHKSSTSFTGFSLLPVSGNMTGTISVFGYLK